MQNEYSLLNREIEAEVGPAAEHFGIGVLPFFPLAHGLLTGKYRPDEPPPPSSRLERPDQRELYDTADWAAIAALLSYAKERELSMLEVAIGGLAAQPAVASIIAGATTAEQVHTNVAAGAWEPAPSDLAALDQSLAAAGASPG